MPLDGMTASKGMTKALKKAAALVPKVIMINEVEYENRGTITVDEIDLLVVVLSEVWSTALRVEDLVEGVEEPIVTWTLNQIGDEDTFITYANTETGGVLTVDDFSQGLVPAEFGVEADTSSFADDFAKAYDDHAAEGIVLGALNVGGAKDIISTFLKTVKDGDTDTVDRFAKALAAFWLTVAIVPGVPAHGGISVASVINDAMAHEADFKAAIEASITTEESKPYYFSLVDNIQKMAVSLIIWTVVELIPTPGGPVPTPFPETIA